MVAQRDGEECGKTPLSRRVAALHGCALPSNGHLIRKVALLQVSRLIIWDKQSTSRETAWQPSPIRPLAGLRVLDLTRIIAGPWQPAFWQDMARTCCG